MSLDSIHQAYQVALSGVVYRKKLGPHFVEVLGEVYDGILEHAATKLTISEGKMLARRNDGVQSIPLPVML